MEHLRAAVPTMSAADFVALEGERLQLPQKLRSASARRLAPEWKQWLKHGPESDAGFESLRLAPRARHDGCNPDPTFYSSRSFSF